MRTDKRLDVRTGFAGKLTTAITAVVLGSACVSTNAPGHSRPGARDYAKHSTPIYIAPNRGIWLTPSDDVRCLDGLPLVCLAGTGRISTSWCYCPSSR